MGLIFFNLMIFTVTLTALLLLVFGIIFAKNKDKSNPKRSNGVWLIVLGAILLPLFLILDIYFLVREASEGADVIGNGALLIGSFFIWINRRCWCSYVLFSHRHILHALRQR